MGPASVPRPPGPASRVTVRVTVPGSAAAVRAVAKEPEMVGALVCRGGRPGLAGIGPLRQVSCPTRVIAGEHDEALTALHQAYDLLECAKDWYSVPGTDDFFREPGALYDAADGAIDWFRRHLRARPTPAAAAAAP